MSLRLEAEVRALAARIDDLEARFGKRLDELSGLRSEFDTIRQLYRAPRRPPLRVPPFPKLLRAAGFRPPKAA